MPLPRAAAIAIVLALAGAHVSRPGSSAIADANSVRGLISEHCVKCHEVPGFPTARQTTSVSAPDFASIAKNPDVYTDERLRSFLGHPHFPMGQFMPSQRSIDDIVAFFKTLSPEK